MKQRRRRLIDWRLFVSITVLALTSYVVWSGVSASNRADEALSTMQQHDYSATQDRAAAAANQRTLLDYTATLTANQRALLDYTATLAARQDALLAYLRAHGIHLPQRLVTVVPRPRIVVRHHHAHRSGSRTRHRSTSTPGTTRGPSGPGKSGSAPGHRKHRPR